MKCLSVKQPWASLIASGRKSIELRTWTTKYRGPIIICAGSSRSRTPNGKHMRELEGDETPVGVAICLVELLDVRATQPGDDTLACCPPDERELAWVLKRLWDLPRVHVKGQLGLWEASPELKSALGI